MNKKTVSALNFLATFAYNNHLIVQGHIFSAAASDETWALDRIAPIFALSTSEERGRVLEAMRAMDVTIPEGSLHGLDFLRFE